MAIDPAWLETDNIERRSGLSLAEFREQYELPNKPVILTDVVGAAHLHPVFTLSSPWPVAWQGPHCKQSMRQLVLSIVCCSLGVLTGDQVAGDEEVESALPAQGV
jgi:hypothetical protein